MTRLFRGNTDVAFGDINLRDAPDTRGGAHNPGAGGWPTIRYFNSETGVSGGNYKKVTDLPMCSELGDRMRMIDYVESYGNTVLCDVNDGRNCNEKELAYIEKTKAMGAEDQEKQVTRLEGMTEKPMKAELAEWAYRRMRILNKLLAISATRENESGEEGKAEL